ncbi:MAG TPA: DUF4956 domain-containing protein [Bacteroidetes bacterium]|nr:DUF4956 domain-containing protein [Bacteroidota bacterium]
MNQELEFLQNLFGTSDQPINLIAFSVQIVLTALLTMLVGYVYVRFGSALSNRRALARTFMLVGVTTMLIITIVKSSLALSLGLVGALSIVRFRTAIKEPEELAFFFMVIGIGLGIGAGQIWVTIIGTAGLCLLVVFINRKKETGLSQNLIIRYLPDEDDPSQGIISLLEKHTSQLELRRLEEQGPQAEIAFVVSFDSPSALLAAKNDLKKQYPSASFNFLELV